MANEAASVAAEEAPPPATEPALPDPPQLTKTDPAQKALKEPAKAQTPLASMDANKGKCLWGWSLEVVSETGKSHSFSNLCNDINIHHHRQVMAVLALVSNLAS